MSPTGHLAIGFSAKRYDPRIPLIVFLIAAYALDLIYFIFLALGIDKLDFDPWSHSLFMAVVWSVSAGLITSLFSRKFRSGLVIGVVVFSHLICLAVLMPFLDLPRALCLSCSSSVLQPRPELSPCISGCPMRIRPRPVTSRR